MKTILLSSRQKKAVLAVMERDRLSDLVVREEIPSIVGNIYKGIVKNYVSAINGVFVDVGIGQNVFIRQKDLLGPIPSEGTSILVQIERESTETKGPLGKGKVVFSGKYTVLLEDTEYIGVSKKIRDEKKRTSLRDIVKNHCPSGMGAIIRTAAESVGERRVLQEWKHLIEERIILEKRFQRTSAPELLFRESDLVVQSIRDFFTEDTNEIVVDDEHVYERLLTVMEEHGVSADEHLRFYKKKIPLLREFGVEEEIRNLLEEAVLLPSGGTLVIQHTEALTVIDVNSGAFHGTGIPREEAAYLVNKEAAREIARQLRLREIGGIILIDFIDMKKEEHQKKTLENLKGALREDRAKTVVCGMTALGLVEMTRKRTAKPLRMHYRESCKSCAGTGERDTIETILTSLEGELAFITTRERYYSDIRILCHPDIAKKIQKNKWSQYFHRHIIVEECGTINRNVFTVVADDA